MKYHTEKLIQISSMDFTPLGKVIVSDTKTLQQLVQLTKSDTRVLTHCLDRSFILCEEDLDTFKTSASVAEC
jgi:hypothetical protein